MMGRGLVEEAWLGMEQVWLLRWGVVLCRRRGFMWRGVAWHGGGVAFAEEAWRRMEGCGFVEEAWVLRWGVAFVEGRGLEWDGRGFYDGAWFVLEAWLLWRGRGFFTRVGGGGPLGLRALP